MLFTRSLRNERMVALLGAMGTEALGYYSWDSMAEEVSVAARKVIDETRSWFGKTGIEIDRRNDAMLTRIEAEAGRLASKKSRDGIADARVTFGILSEGFRQIRLPRLAREFRVRLTDFRDEDDAFNPAAVFRRRIAQLFLTRKAHKGASSSAVRPLLESLGINRFATLNYDFELERALMLRKDEANTLVDGVEVRDRLLIGRPAEEVGTILSMIGTQGSGRRITREEPATCLSRVMGDGLTVKSDIVDRERPDRLLEFAIGSSEVNRHILHLHGRADEPGSMVFDIGDYDERYRRDDLFRNPFEHGMRVLFAGNPILFVGLGMTETEVNDKLQYFVSNTPYRRMAPAFLIWNTLSAKVDDPTNEDEILQWMADKRVDFLTRLGVYIIFDRDLVDRDDAEMRWRKPRSGVYAAHHFAGEEAPLKRLIEDYNGCTHLLEAYEKDREKAKKRGASAAVRELDAALEQIRGEQRQTQLDALAATLTALPRIVAYTEAFSNRQGDRQWRTANLRQRLMVNRKQDKEKAEQPVRMWGSPNLREAAASNALLPGGTKTIGTPPTIMLGISSSGVGRGVFGEQIAQAENIPNGLQPGWNFHHTKRGDRLLINAGFSYDSDSMLSAIAMFLQDRVSPGFKFEKEPLFREEVFVRGDLFRGPKALIIINGIDRFFSFDGDPLSAEVDHLMRCIIKHPRESKVQWLLLATPRVARYFSALAVQPRNLDALIRKTRPGLSTPAPTTTPVDEDEPADEEEEEQGGDEIGLTVSQSQFLNWIAHNCSNAGVNGKTAMLTDGALAKLKHAKEIDTEAVRRAFFAGYLSPLLIRALDIDCPVAFEVLRTMAFIGVPMEGEVLLRTPAVRAMLEERCGVQALNAGSRDEACRGRLEATIEHLASMALIIEIRPEVEKEDTKLWVRYGLHRSVAAELRERHGAPISDAKLSTTFNMSLFVAQPEDRYTPKRDFHEELGTLVDRLTGAWKDVEEKSFPHITEDMLDQSPDGWLTRPHGMKADRYLDFVKLVHRSSAACLRVALAVVRGYYSTANLLTFDRLSYGKYGGEEGALTEHANRIDRILRTFGHISMARQNCRAIIATLRLPEKEEKALLATLGDEPWYPDDLVWLHNERAVCKLVQGHLYGARRSLSLAEATNRRVEGETRGHNWRRIRMNMVALLIERGRLRRAQRVIDEIEWTIDEAPWTKIGEVPDGSRKAADDKKSAQRRTDQIRARFGAPGEDLADMLTVDFSREEIMMTGLTTAYRGLVAHMRGDYRNAEARYCCGIAILRRLGELRAYSIFQRHYAALLSVLGTRTERIREVSLAVVAADAIQQSDVAHRARVLRASAVRNDPSRSDENRRAALEDLREALEQASISDSFRVRVEAGAALAREMRLNGDYETALRYASDALAIACRYGHSLQKIWLRVEIGQILIRRGDPKSGEAMLDCAERSAIRTGYKRTIERIHRARSQQGSLEGAFTTTREPARTY